MPVGTPTTGPNAEQKELFLSADEKRELLERVDFQQRGVGPKRCATLKRLIVALEETPADTRIAEVIAAKMGVGRSTYQRTLQLAQRLDPSPITITSVPGRASVIAPDWHAIRRRTALRAGDGSNTGIGANRSATNPHGTKWEASQNNGRPPKIMGGLPKKWEGSFPSHFPSKTHDSGENGRPPIFPHEVNEYETHDHEARKGKNGRGRSWTNLIGRTLSRDDLLELSILRTLYESCLESGGAVLQGEAGLHDFCARAHCAWRIAKSNAVGLFWSAIFRGGKLAPSIADDDFATELRKRAFRAAGPVCAAAEALGVAFDVSEARGCDVAEPPAYEPSRRRTPAEQQLELKRRLETSRR